MDISDSERGYFRKRYGSFDSRSKECRLQEEPPRGFYICWPWNWWCLRGDLPEEEERLIRETRANDIEPEENSDDELLSDHVVSQEEIATASSPQEPNNEADVLRERVDQLEQQLKREEQQRRCYEDKIEQLRQLYESARTSLQQQIQEQTVAQQQGPRLKELEHQLQQNFVERKSLEEAPLKEAEGRHHLEDLFLSQILHKELQLESHLKEEETQLRRLHQHLACEEERKSIENILEKVKLQKQSLQKRCGDLESQLNDEIRRRVYIENELLLARTSEQKLQQELKDIRKYLSKIDKASKLYSEKQPEDELLRNDNIISDEHVYWSIPENDWIFDDGKLTEFQKMSNKQEHEELRRMLERAIEEKVRLQRSLQKELTVRQQMQIRAKKELNLQRKIMEKEFRKQLSRIEKMIPIGIYYQQNEKTNFQEDKNDTHDYNHSIRSLSTNSISSTEEESEEEAQSETDVASDIIPESVDEEERQEIRQLLLEELQRLQAHVKEEQELKGQGLLKENESYRESRNEEQKILSSEYSNHNPKDLEKEKNLGEDIQAIFRKQPLKPENELFNIASSSKISDTEILERSTASNEFAPLTIGKVETKIHTNTNSPIILPQILSSMGSELSSSPILHQSSQDKEFHYLRMVKNTTNKETHNKIASESDILVSEQLLKHPEHKFELDHEENWDSCSPRLANAVVSEDVEFHEHTTMQDSESDGLNEQIVSTSRAFKTFRLIKPNVTEQFFQEIFDTLVNFQGYSVCLRALLGEKNADKELLTLLQHCSKQTTSLSALSSVAQTNTIKRSVQRKTNLKEDILKQKVRKLRTTFAISGVSKEELQGLLPRGETVGQLKHSGIEEPARTFVIVDATTAESDYEELCAKAKYLRDIHWIHNDLVEGVLIWKKSCNNIRDIREYIDTQRSNIYTSLADVNERCSVISTSSGEGTSTFLKQLAVDFKERDATFWIVKLEVSKIRKEIMESCTTQEHVLAILWKYNGSNSDLEKKLFEHCFYRTGKIILLLEDVHKNITGSQIFLKVLLETKVHRIIITVHPRWQNEIEDTVSSLAFTFTPLSDYEQNEILIQRWKIPDGDKKRAEDFSAALLRAAAIGNLTFTPLHLIMVADSYKTSLESYLFKNCIDIPTIIDESLLYEKYIEICFEQESLENTRQFHILRSKYFSSITYYALRLLFPEHNSAFQFGEEDGSSVKPTMKKLHYCIAEYLCAKWFEEHFEEARSLIRENYFNKKFQRLWFLFDKGLSEASELHMASLYGDIKGVEKLIEAGTYVHALDCGGRKPIHIAAIHGHISVVKLLVQNMEKQSAGKDRVLNWTPLRYGDESGNWEMVEVLLEAGECPSDIERARQSIHDESAFQKLITKAASKGYKNLFRSLLSVSGFSVNSTLHSGSYSYQKYTLLHIVAENGHSEMLDYLMRMPVIRADLEAWDGSTPLHLAARHGHTENVRRLISRTTSLVFNKQGDTPLHEAVRNGHVNVATILLANDADPNIRNEAGDCPLHIACSNGDITFVSILLDYGAEKCIPNGNDNTPLDCAIRCGQSTVVRYLVEKCGKDIVIDTGKRKCPTKITSLHVAASVGDILPMEYLLRVVDRDAINTPSVGGDTPLHFAALHGCSSMVEYLISKCGTNPVLTNRYGNTAVHLAVVRGDYSTVRVLLAHTAAHKDIANCEGNLPLHLAACQGNLKMIRCLLQHDQDNHTVAVKNREMKTPIQLAMERDSVDINVVKAFVESNSDVNVRDRHGNTLLHRAVFSARIDITKLLLDTNLALTELRNSSGYTALLSAVKTGQPEMVFVLARGGANVNVRTSDGNPALHEAVATGNPKTAIALLECGAYPNARNAEGNTALHRAIFANNVDMVRLLVEHGADKNDKNMQKQSPRDLALHLNAMEDILRYL